MRVVLDGVFNHTGYDSRYFNARGHYDSVGAFQSKESPYFSWFDFHNWPNGVRLVVGHLHAPQVNESDGSYQDYIIEDEDSVVRRWLRLGASGWRLDVADELPDSFIQKLNAAARRRNPMRSSSVRCGRMRPTKLRTRASALFPGRRTGFRHELPAARRHPRLFERRHRRAFRGEHGVHPRKPIRGRVLQP